jgi:hypothetical protein
VVIDGDLISGKHPGIIDMYLDIFLKELEPLAQRSV